MATQRLQEWRVGFVGMVFACAIRRMVTPRESGGKPRVNSGILKLVDRDIQPIAGDDRANELEQTLA